MGDPEAISQGTKLQDGYQLVRGGEELYLQPDGNLVVYLMGANGAGPALWSSGTWGNPGDYALMQGDGNFVIYRQGGGPGIGGAFWSTGTWYDQFACATFAADGQFEVKGVNGRLWTSGTGPLLGAPGDLAPQYWLGGGQMLGPGQWIASDTVWLVMQADGNLVLYRKRDGAPLASSGTWDNPGAYVTLQVDGNLVVYRAGRSDPAGALWSTGTWGNPNDLLVAQSDGNLVLYQRDSLSRDTVPLWSTGTWGQA
jgi:hypothetical protein